VVFALIGAIVVGLSLGLLGSGGSILTVPVLVYLVDQPEKVAIAGSLAIVGGISLIAAVPHAMRRRVDWRNVVLFGVPGLVGAYIGAAVSRFVPGAVQLLLFAVVMLAAAYFMVRPSPAQKGGEGEGHPGGHKRSPWMIGVEGLTVGAFTGLVGVGGGFLIVPALVLLGGLPMSRAVGTSLVIIAMKSASGFFEYLNVLAEKNLEVDWKVIGLFIGLGAAGSFAGSAIGSRIPEQLLKRGFAAFLLVLGIYIIAKNLPPLLA
jgi:hypothetical protein